MQRWPKRRSVSRSQKIYRISALFICISFVEPTFAADELATKNPLRLGKFDFEEKEEKTQILLGTLVGQISAAGGSLLAAGLQLSFQYTLSRSWAFQGDLSLALQPTDGFGFLYSGTRILMKYALTGDYRRFTRTVSHNDKTVVKEIAKSDRGWELGAGLGQLLISGSEAVYSAPGLFLNVSRYADLLGRSSVIGFTYAMLTGPGQNSITGMILEVSIPLGAP